MQFVFFHYSPIETNGQISSQLSRTPQLGLTMTDVSGFTNYIRKYNQGMEAKK
jgi:hypothetical protein